MNTDTGEIRDEADLTEADKKSGKWVALQQRDLQRLAQLETERLARRNNGVTPELVQSRLQRAEAKRARKAQQRRTTTAGRADAAGNPAGGTD